MLFIDFMIFILIFVENCLYFDAIHDSSVWLRTGSNPPDSRVGPDTGYLNYQAGYPIWTDIQLTLMKLSGRISDNLVFYSKQYLYYPAQPYRTR